MPDFDLLACAQALVRCPSVTPEDHGALEVVANALAPLGFHYTFLEFDGDGAPKTRNLVASWAGQVGEPHFAFAGHTDVVPAGHNNAWTYGPFDGVIDNDILYGRGIADMKGAIACFIAALYTHVKKFGKPRGRVTLIISGDEEGNAGNGTPKILKWLTEQDLVPDHCLVGEPTNPQALGDAIKIGRRGSINFTVTVTGKQGHTAYPHQVCNPNHIAAEIITTLTARPLDSGNSYFDPSTLQVTSLKTLGDTATNLVPAQCAFQFNSRFNDLHTAHSLTHWLQQVVDLVLARYPIATAAIDSFVSGEPFITQPGWFTTMVLKAIEDETGRIAKFDTGGGTSDARFIKDYCSVVEFGLINQTIHQVDECAAVADLQRLAAIYGRMLEAYFQPGTHDT